jgi:hypothetical protein
VSSSQLAETRDRVRSFGGYNTSAEALDEADYKRMLNLGAKFFQLQEDMLNVQKGSPLVEKECLDDLQNDLERISIRIEALTSMVSLASSMVNKLDEQMVLATLNMDATSFLKHIELGRKGINSTAGYCSSNNVAVAKAQEILKLYDEATSVVRSMMSRLR